MPSERRSARLAEPTLLEQAKHLGLAYGRALIADSEEEMTLIFDLAIHSAKPGRSRQFDRYAKATAGPMKANAPGRHSSRSVSLAD